VIPCKAGQNALMATAEDNLVHCVACDDVALDAPVRRVPHDADRPDESPSPHLVLSPL
jgi:hypothetical protein